MSDYSSLVRDKVNKILQRRKLVTRTVDWSGLEKKLQAFTPKDIRTSARIVGILMKAEVEFGEFLYYVEERYSGAVGAAPVAVRTEDGLVNEKSLPRMSRRRLKKASAGFTHRRHATRKERNAMKRSEEERGK